jgi:hypothetical protein
MCKKSAKADQAKIREILSPHLLLFFVLLIEDMLHFYLYYMVFVSISHKMHTDSKRQLTKDITFSSYLVSFWY